MSQSKNQSSNVGMQEIAGIGVVCGFLSASSYQALRNESESLSVSTQSLNPWQNYNKYKQEQRQMQA